MPTRRGSLPPPLALDLAADLARWRVFLAVADLGSLTRAALHLDTTQSMLSRQINALERDCGARLFNRTGRGVALSDLGQRIRPQVQALLEGAVALQEDIRGDARAPAGRVTLGVLPSIGITLVGPLFGALRVRHPAVALKVLEGSSGQVEEWLADARVDLAILYRYGGARVDGEELLANVDSYLVGARGDRLTSAAEVPFARLDGLPFILPGAPNGLRTALDTQARAQHIALAPAIEADSLPLQRTLVADERLYTVLPLHAVWAEVQQGVLQAARIVEPPLERRVTMASARAKGPPPAVRAVAEEIKRQVAQMAARGLWRAGGAVGPA